MKALEFQSTLQPDATLRIPSELARQVPADRPLRVIVLVPEDAEEQDWERLTTEEFLRGYDRSDDIYDDLPTR